MTRPFLLPLALLLLCAPGAVSATEELPAGQGWYVVRPGDTLEDVTARFLGSSERWRENWELNPDVRDPHRIFPGKRLRILLPETLPEGAALLEKTSRDVKDLMRPHDWQPARRADLLRDRDGVRTFAASSAELRVGASSRLTLTEDSLVFVGRERGPERVGRDLIQLDLGQADLRATAPVAAGAIEVVVGDARARPRSDDDGGEAMKGRFRRPEAGGVQLMVYGGASELEAGGAAVEVPAGMGTSAPAGAPPAPPEELLAAPSGLEPVDGTRIWSAPRPLSWTLLPGAASYTAEICADPECGQLLARATGLGGPPWTPPADLPSGDVFVRLTAVSASGLDGYPSDHVRWTLEDGADPSPPAVALSFDGPHARMQGRWHVLPTTGLRIDADDPESGVTALEIRRDGRPVGAGELAGPFPPGARLRLAATATNGAGGVGHLEETEVRVDGDAPTVIAGGEIVDAELYAQGTGAEARAAGPGDDLVWRPLHGRFAPLDHAELLDPDAPAVLRTERILVRRAAAGAGAAIATDRSHWTGRRVALEDRVDEDRAGRWIEVLDRGAGITRVALRDLGGSRVEVVAVDALGQETRVEVTVE